MEIDAHDGRFVPNFRDIEGGVVPAFVVVGGLRHDVDKIKVRVGRRDGFGVGNDAECARLAVVCEADMEVDVLTGAPCAVQENAVTRPIGIFFEAFYAHR